MDRIRRLLGQHQLLAAALITLLTLGIAGAVVMVTTSAGCGAANKFGLKATHCVNPNPVAIASPTARPFPPPSSTPAQSPSSGSPSPEPSPTPPASPPPLVTPPYGGATSASAPPLAGAASGLPAGTLSCRLPIYAGGPGSGGFIVIPGKTFVADPRSTGTVPSPSPGGPSPNPPQYGGYAGWFGLTYDAPYSKWLPVPFSWMSPDGKHYAYPLGGDVYVQDVSAGSLQELSHGQSLNPVGVVNDGVYAANRAQGGLWFLPFSGSQKQIATTGFWQGIGKGAAYGTATSQVPRGVSNTINRLDLNTGGIVPYFADAGGQSNVIGFDAEGYPVIQTNYNSGQAIFIVTAPSTSIAIASVVWSPYQQSAPFPTGTPVADSHGLWFGVGGQQGIVLYAGGTWYWLSSIGGNLAGKCA